MMLILLKNYNFYSIKMKTINDVTHAMKRLYFKAHLVKEYHDFEYIRKKLIDEFFYDELDDSELDNLLNMVDDIHIRFLTEQMPDNQKTIDDFRHTVFKLIKQKISTRCVYRN